MIRCATYNRQSLDKDVGIQTQKKLNREAAERHGWTVVKEYVDNDVSASKPRGPGTAWHQMFQDAKAKEFTHVIATDLDRITRGMRDLLDFQDLGLRVLTLDGEIDLTTAEGEARASNSVTWARFEVRRKSERQVRAAIARAEKGIPHKSKRPFGWELDGMTVREDEAVWVRYAVEEVLRGTSLRAVVRHLNAQGVPTSRGKEWTGQGLKKLLLRPRNAGIFVRYGEVMPTSLIQPIISADEHARVTAILEGRMTGLGAPVRKHWATSLAKCATCGSGLRGHNTTSRGNQYVYYVCDSTLARKHEPTGTKHPSIRDHILERGIADAVASAYLFGTSELNRSDAAARHPLQAALRAAQADREGIKQGWADGAYTRSEYNADLRANLKEQERLQEQLATLDAASAGASLVAGFVRVLTPDGRASFDKSGQAKRDLRERFLALPIESRRQLATELLDVEVHPGYGKDRVRIHHRVVTSLNESDHELDPDPAAPYQ